MSQPYRAIIVDDEAHACDELQKLIGLFCPHLQICGSAGTVGEAVASIRQHRPEIVFLDVDLRDGSGFDILDIFPKPEFKVVFISTHDDFALKAFRYRAFHYLIKPIDPQDLIAVMEELYVMPQQWPENELLQQSLKRTQQGKLLLPTVQGVAFIRSAEISYIFSDNKYATVVLESGEKIFVSHSLKEIGAILPPGEFVRPHQSWIVRIEAIRKVQKGDGLYLFLKDKVTVPVSRRNKNEVFRALGLGL